MNHEEIRKKFGEFLDGELEESQANEIRKHLEECKECNEEWNIFKDAFNAIKGINGIKAPEQLVTKIKKRIYRRSRGRYFSSDVGPFLYRVPHEIFSLIIIIMIFIIFFLMSQLVVFTTESMYHDGSSGDTSSTPSTGEVER